MIDEDGKLTGLNTGKYLLIIADLADLMMLACSTCGMDQGQWGQVEDGGGAGV